METSCLNQRKTLQRWRHCELFRISRPHRARNENGDNAAPHTQQGSPGHTARCQSGGPEVSLQTMHFLYLGVVLSTQAPTLCHTLMTDPTRVGMLRSFQAGALRFGRCFVHTKGAPAKDRGDGHPAVRACGSESWPGALRGPPNGTLKPPPNGYWFPSPTTHRPDACYDRGAPLFH